MPATTLIDLCRFLSTAGGTTDWTYASTVVGYQSPTLARAVNGRTYHIRAESADLSQWEISEGAYSSSGAGSFARTTVLYNSSGSGTMQGGAGTKISFSAVPQIAIVTLAQDLAPTDGLIYGLGTSNSSDAVNDIDILAGVATDLTNGAAIRLTSTLTKRLDAAWAVGTNQGGLDAGSIADYDATSTTSNTLGIAAKTFTTQASKAFTAGSTIFIQSSGTPANYMQGTVTSYSGTTLVVDVLYISGSGTNTDWNISQRVVAHLFLIQRSDTGVVDALFSTSPTAPTMPANYDCKRRIRSIVRERFTIKAYYDYGDYVKWASAAMEWTGTTNLSARLMNLCVPTGFPVIPMLATRISQNTAGGSGWIVGDGYMGGAAYNLSRTSVAGEYSIVHTQNFVTNTAGQIQVDFFFGGTINVSDLTTFGYIDGRGR